MKKCGRNQEGENNGNWKGGVKFDRKYKQIWTPDHPRARKGYVYEHILLAEKALGKHLPSTATVHHHTPEQLVVCEDHGYHMLLHQRQRAIEACGHADWRLCKYCHQYGPPSELISAKHTGSYHRSCNLEYQRVRNEAALSGPVGVNVARLLGIDLGKAL